MKRVRTHGAASIFAAALLAMALTAGSARADEREPEEYAFSSGDRLVFDFEAGGTAIVTGWDEEKASVSYYYGRRSRRSDHHDDEDHRNQIRISSDKGALQIDTGSTGRHDYFESLTFEIRVPKKARIDFESKGGGLELHDLEGEFEGWTMGGAFVLTDVIGEVDLETGGGSIEVRDCGLDGQIRTGGGEVLLENVVGDLEAHSGGGDVRFVNVRDSEGRMRSPDGGLASDSTEETVLITSAGGGIHVRSAPAGARVQTGGGDVVVSRAERFVEARTGGGDVRVEVREGWADVQTGAGDVEVDILEGLGDGDGGVKVFTGLGNVYVQIPDGASIDIDAEIGYTRSSRRNFRITSDFDLEVHETERWDHEHGSPKKFIRGTAEIDGGRHRVRIRTTNGNIRIEKGD